MRAGPIIEASSNTNISSPSPKPPEDASFCEVPADF